MKEVNHAKCKHVFPVRTRWIDSIKKTHIVLWCKDHNVVVDDLANSQITEKFQHEHLDRLAR